MKKQNVARLAVLTLALSAGFALKLPAECSASGLYDAYDTSNDPGNAANMGYNSAGDYCQGSNDCLNQDTNGQYVSLIYKNTTPPPQDPCGDTPDSQCPM